jgi:2-polyprenyl-3-methyl-5-hydroxy-6-metoxy-1,4-benzoquinol methylase
MSVTAEAWVDVNAWERGWWSNCTNTFTEERKQLVYAKYMGLTVAYYNEKSHFGIRLGGKSVLDIGGGPVSLLLKCDAVRGKVVDPCRYPDWVYQRYAAADIAHEVMMGEDIVEAGYDEVWIYNCLQHVRDPAKILQNARRAAHVIRIFEWVNAKPHVGHPHMLSKVMLDRELRSDGRVEIVNQDVCRGVAYFGAFIC